MEKGQTMAYNYYNLFILRSVVLRVWVDTTNADWNTGSTTTTTALGVPCYRIAGTIDAQTTLATADFSSVKDLTDTSVVSAADRQGLT